MDRAEILTVIPHRPPMLMVDEVLSCDERHILARKTFTGDEFFFQGHYPDYPLVPGVILCEAGLQCGAILLARHAAASYRDHVPVATRLNHVKFKRMVRPGDDIEIDVTLVERLADAFFLQAKVRCQGKLAAQFDFACTMAPPAAES